MRKYIGLLLATALICAMAAAQDLDSLEEFTAGNFYGIGARQMGMGGCGIASSQDGAALYYNPAALTLIHRIEFQASLTHQKFENTTSQKADRYVDYTSIKNKASIDRSNTRLGSLNLAVPVPTYRGALTVAFGVHRIASFDRVTLWNVIDQNGPSIVEDYSKEFSEGSIFIYSAAAGIDLSPNVSAGLAINVYSGDHTVTYNDRLRVDADESEIETTINESYIAASLKGGLMMRPSSSVTVGLVVESPINYQVEWNLADYVNGTPDRSIYTEYDLKHPFKFGGGLAIRKGWLTLTGEAEFVDWSQLSYGDNIDMQAWNDTLSELYRSVVNLRAGAEYEFPSWGLSLRGGIFSEPLPYSEDYIDKDRAGISLGFGWLIDQVILLEGAVVHSSWERHYTAANDLPAKAEDTFNRAFITFSYRY